MKKVLNLTQHQLSDTQIKHFMKLEYLPVEIHSDFKKGLSNMDGTETISNIIGYYSELIQIARDSSCNSIFMPIGSPMAQFVFGKYIRSLLNKGEEFEILFSTTRRNEDGKFCHIGFNIFKIVDKYLEMEWKPLLD